MNIAIAQLNYHIGNLTYNSEKIIKSIEEAKKNKIDLLIFSELSICGYPPFDMLNYEHFIDSCTRKVNEIAENCDNISVILGSPTINHNKGKKLFNSAIVISNKKIIDCVHKTLLPTYDVFNDDRYFETNNSFKLIKINNCNIAITICEDLWYEFDDKKLYQKSPMEELIKLNPDLIVNIAGSPYSSVQNSIRKDVLQSNSKKYKLPLIYANQVGANTDLVYDGGSMFINRKSEIVKKAKKFKEDFISLNFSEINDLAPVNDTTDNALKDLNDALVLGLKDFLEKNNFKKLTLGLSGGIDSAVALAIAVQATKPKNIDVLLLPSVYSSEHSVSDAMDMVEKCSINAHKISIEEIRKTTMHAFKDLFTGTEEGTCEENIQARIRGLLLMAYSNKFGNVLVNTSNKSEAAVGYTTLYGDMNGSISVLGDVYKSDVYKLAKYINKNIAEIIPTNIINKTPSAELKPDQKDSDSLPEYHILDEILFNYIEKTCSSEQIIKLGFDEKTVKRVIKLVNMSEYKRFQQAPVIRVSQKSFGHSRIMPLVANTDYLL